MDDVSFKDCSLSQRVIWITCWLTDVYPQSVNILRDSNVLRNRIVRSSYVCWPIISEETLVFESSFLSLDTGIVGEDNLT